MIKNLSYRLFILLVSVLAFAIPAGAQADPIRVDSIIEEAGNAPASAADYASPVDEELVTSYADTLNQNFRSVVDDTLQSINNDKGFYYKKYMDSLLRATLIKKPKPRRELDLSGGDFFSSALGIVFWILAIGLFAYLVYRLFLSNSALFSRNRKNLASDLTVTIGEYKNDPDTLIRNAIKSGNYRLAVRYLYLQLLGNLAERKIIEISSNKTNYEYVTEVRKHKFANEFASLTLQYDYVWYGEYPVDEKLFDQIQSSFNQFNKNLSR